jgi:hypothetical protein
MKQVKYLPTRKGSVLRQIEWVALIKGYKKKGNESFQKISKKHLRDWKEVVLLHPLRETCYRDWGEKKQEEHVPRHIELTAVLERS